MALSQSKKESVFQSSIVNHQLQVPLSGWAG
jgi:hypothetical protein